MQVTGVPPMPITLGVVSPTIVPIATTVPDMAVATMVPAQEALAVTTVPDTPAIMMPPAQTTPAATHLVTITEAGHELSVPKIILSVHNQLQMRVS